MFKMNCSQCGEMYYIGAGCPCWKKYTVPTYNVPLSIPKNQIEFRSDANNTWVMRITADRRIEVNEDVEVTEAAQKVLDAMQHLLNPRTWIGLTDDDKVLIKHDALFNQYMTAGEYADIVQQLTEARLKDKNT
jgi:hypothetical protein